MQFRSHLITANNNERHKHGMQKLNIAILQKQTMLRKVSYCAVHCSVATNKWAESINIPLIIGYSMFSRLFFM